MPRLILLAAMSVMLAWALRELLRDVSAGQWRTALLGLLSGGLIVAGLWMILAGV